MRCRLRGIVEEVLESSVVIDTGAVGYEVLVPRASLAEFERLRGQEVTLLTMEFLDGGIAGTQMTPRMIGFLTSADRGFFNELVKVRSVGLRKALRIMALPAAHLAAAIEHGDERVLAGLPEVGKRTAAQIVADLRGRVGEFAAPEARPSPAPELDNVQRLALEMLIKWGERPAEAQRWLAQAKEQDPALREPDAYIKAAYRIKQGLQRIPG